MTVSEPPLATALSGIDDEALATLRSRFRGPLLRPEDDDYEAARRVWNGMIDRRPALIARCAGVADVIAAVDFARAHDLLLAVRGGGHNVAGNAVCDGGLVVDLSRLKGIRVDPAARTVRAEAGVTWGELDHETQAFGLATTGGQVSTTGIAGLTLGGGYGWLTRSFGMACDNLLAADVVTADGHFLTASAEEHPDLFWGLRGGGGNFGAVTSFTYRLQPVGSQLIAGVVLHPLAAARDALRFYRDFAATAPDELTCTFFLMTSPDGVPLIGLFVVYVGSLSDGEAVVQPLRAFGSPVADLIGPTPYCALQAMFDSAFPAGRRSYWKSGYLPGWEDGAIDTLVEHFTRVPSPFSGVGVEHYGGAVSRVGPGETAFVHRGLPYNLLILAGWDDPTQDEVNIRWTRELWAAMRPFAVDAVYVNTLGDARDEGEERVRDAYAGATYDRLSSLKRTYDPTNFFRVNQNIKPA
jgi:FAD/FMN-containing dehydrogenase